MSKNQFDLHIHTYLSDGKDAPPSILLRAKRAGLALVSITDHNSVSGIFEEQKKALQLRLNFLAGIEISAVYQHRHIHLLGYGFNFKSPALKKVVSGVQFRRQASILRIAEKLRRVGFEISDAELRNQRAEYLGLVHIVRILMKKPREKRKILQEVGSEDIFAIIKHYFSAASEAYIPEEYLPAKPVIRMIKQARGVVSLAHPGSHLGYHEDALISSLKSHGLDALEVFTPKHNWDQIVHYELLAKKFQLAVTAGSNYHEDFHRQDIPVVTPLGFLKTPARVYGDLLKFLRKKLKYQTQF